MKLIYLASPYSGKGENKLAVEQSRFEQICTIAARLMNEGNHIFSPIAHCHPIAVKHDLPTDWAYWQAYLKVMLPRCDEIWIAKMDGWDVSTGVQAEIKLAEELGKPIKYVEP
jgi:hypothetical protein